MKADGSVLVHSDGGSYKPLNWMSPPCWLEEREAGAAVPPESESDSVPVADAAPVADPALDTDTAPDTAVRLWVVTNKAGEELRITVEDIEHDSKHELGVDPGLVKDGVEAHLQELLAEHIGTLGDGYSLIRREYMTAIGPVDILCRDADGATVAVEIKRRGEIDGVEQLTRYLELLNRDPLLAPVSGVFAAQQIKPQARTLATDRGIRCVTLDYDALRGTDSAEFRLF